MYKKLLLLTALLIILPSFSFAGYEEARKVIATDVVDALNNFILVQKDSEQWLLHHKKGCGNVQEGDELTLVVRGDLDGNRETLWNGNYLNCIVDQAELVTGKLTVTTSSGANNHTSVSDGGKPFRIYYNELCKAMKGMKGRDVYVRKYGGNKLKAGDQIFLPGSGESCALTYVEPEDVTPEEPEPSAEDTKRPTTPTRVRAFPSNTSVYLYWKAATDNKKVAYYIISTSLFHFDDQVAQDPVIKPEPMPDTFRTETNRPSFKLTGLEPDELYYFRVIAVDTSGNESSYWSEEAKAYTKSSIAQTTLKSVPLTVSLKQETDTSFLFGWNEIPGSDYTVILEADKKRVVIQNDWKKTSFRVFKKTSLEGKKLTLIVRSVDSRGIDQESKINFELGSE